MKLQAQEEESMTSQETSMRAQKLKQQKQYPLVIPKTMAGNQFPEASSMQIQGTETQSTW